MALQLGALRFPSSLGTGLLLLAVVGGVASVLVLTMPFPSEHAERRLCDRAVDALLHSKDLVEVERAGIIIREVNCAIGRRLIDQRLSDHSGPLRQRQNG
jgi:hypothetical protein